MYAIAVDEKATREIREPRGDRIERERERERGDEERETKNSIYYVL